MSPPRPPAVELFPIRSSEEMLELFRRGTPIYFELPHDRGLCPCGCGFKLPRRGRT